MSGSSNDAPSVSPAYRNLSKLRIRQWEHGPKRGAFKDRFRLSSEKSRGTVDEERLASAAACEQILGDIKAERLQKARNSSWTGYVTWIHIPVNDMNLCELVLRKVCRERQSSALLRPEHWEEQLHEPFTSLANLGERKDQYEVPFMDARSWAFDTDVLLGSPTHGHDSSHSKIVQTTILFMPYLHWDYVDTHCQRVSMMRSTDTTEQQPGVHPRRSLDEAAFRHHNYDSLIERNTDQVVTRFIENQRDVQKIASTGGISFERPTLMMVDQLWLWILDNDTIVTSFPDAPGEHIEGKSFEKRKCHYLHLECLAWGRVNSRNQRYDASGMAEAIIYRSYSIFWHHYTRESPLRYIDMFRKSIENERARAADLFLALRHRNPGRERKPNENGAYPSNTTHHRRARPARVPSIREDMEAVANVRDIEEELRIMIYIVQLQIKTLKNLTHPNRHCFNSDLTGFKTDLDDLCQETRDVHERLFQTLELKQTLLSIRQNRIVLTFTVITIIFLPLGFISSLFGMNATEFNDGSPVNLGRIFAYMFPTSFFISSLALGLAFGLFDSVGYGNDISSMIPKYGKKHRNIKELSSVAVGS